MNGKATAAPNETGILSRRPKMGADITYLLFLQELRNATGGIFNEIFNAFSKIAVDVMVFLPYVILWGFDKEWGYRFVATDWAAELVNGIIKLTVCAYRPWIRSSQIEPAGDSKVAATGYSFPSGHTTKATAMYGTVAIWQYKKRRWLSVLCVIMIVLTGFSRNFLGVHTPQDVIVGFLSTTILVLFIGWLGNKLKGNEKLQDYMTLAGICLIAVTLIYIIFKPYPMDYVDGALLVDPQKMMNDTFKGCGGFLGFLVGAYIDRKYLHYEIPVGAANLPLLTGVGLGIIFSWKEYIEGATLILIFGSHWGNFISRFIMVMFAMVIWPVAIRKWTAPTTVRK